MAPPLYLKRNRLDRTLRNIMKKFLLVAGARPNFMKIAPLVWAFQARGLEPFIVHTGQHSDANMSEVFFADLNIPPPNINLAVGGGDRVELVKKIVFDLTPIIKEVDPAAVIIVGDVNSSFAATLAAVEAGAPVVHVEAGLRSFNLQMPEETNRVAIDHYADLLFVTEESGLKNLQDEGVAPANIFLVGNVMIDTLLHVAAAVGEEALAAFSVTPQKYALVTLHRPQNVDDPQVLRSLIQTINKVSEIYPVIFALHPRTRERMAANQISLAAGVQCVEPQPYRTNVALMKYAACVLTDSGGIQEETTVLGVPCLTLRTETERPATVSEGTNEVVGIEQNAILAAVEKVRQGKWKKGSIPKLWDGQAAERIVKIILEKFAA